MQGSGARGFQSLPGLWGLPRPGIEPVSPALAGRILTPRPPGKSQPSLLVIECFVPPPKEARPPHPPPALAVPICGLAACGHSQPRHWPSAWRAPRSRGFPRLVGTALLGVGGSPGEGAPVLNQGSDCSSSTRSAPAASCCESGLCSASTFPPDLAALQAWLAS